MLAHRLRLRRTKVKEMEARPFQDICDADKVHRKMQIIFHAFGGPKAPQWGGLIQVAPGTHTRQRGLMEAQKSKQSKCFQTRTKV